MAKPQKKWQEQYDLGQQYLLEENYEEAIVAFTAAIEIDPKQADAYLERGDAYILSGETEENSTQVLADYRQVLEMDETNAFAYLGVADVYIRQGDYETALEVLNEGLGKIGENEKIEAKIEEIESGNITDSSGFLRRERRYDSEGALRWYLDFTYDDEGRKMSVTSYTFLGEQIDHVSLEYDENGTLIANKSYDGAGNLIGSQTYDN